MQDCGRSQFNGQMIQDSTYQLNSSNYSYPGHNPCSVQQSYSNCYPSSPPQTNETRSWNVTGGNSEVVPQNTSHVPVNAPVATTTDAQIQDLYQFSPLSGDLFQPEEIFQLDQPLNQSKVNRHQTPPQTLLDLGSGTIQLKGTVVTNNAAQLNNDSQYYSYEETRPSIQGHKYSGVQDQSPYQYQGTPKYSNQFGSSGYCESSTVWKEGNDENGNNLLRTTRKSPQTIQYTDGHDYYSTIPAQEGYNYQMGCQEAPPEGQQRGLSSCYNPQGTNHVTPPNVPVASSTYFIQSTSSYLPPEIISPGVSIDQINQNHYSFHNKSH